MLKPVTADDVPMPAPAPAGLAAPDRWTLEATLPDATEIGSLAHTLPTGSAVYLSALPHAHYERQFRAAVTLREAGFEPVPHLAARHFASEEDLAGYLARMTGSAGVERVLLIGGDIEIPRGPYASSLDVLASGPFRESGIREAGIAGYPEGHPAISDDALHRALHAKVAVAKRAGVALHIVSQFCFSVAPIRTWLAGLAAQGIALPASVGLAGPASPRTLLRFALRCGVDLPVRKANVAAQLLMGVSPDAIVGELDREGGLGGYPGPVTVHLYSFGGLARTAAWLHEAREGRRPRAAG